MLDMNKLNIEGIKKAWKEGKTILLCRDGDRQGINIINISQFGTGFYNVSFKIDNEVKMITLGPSGCEINSGDFIFWEIWN